MTSQPPRRPRTGLTTSQPRAHEGLAYLIVLGVSLVIGVALVFWLL